MKIKYRVIKSNVFEQEQQSDALTHRATGYSCGKEQPDNTTLVGVISSW